MIDPMKVIKYSNQILEIVNEKAEMADSDFQGALEAVVMNIIGDIQKSK